MTSVAALEPHTRSESLGVRYSRIRAVSESICAPLELEDYVVQSMPDVSPTKWHLAHTTWFFERFLLRSYYSNYVPFHPQFDYLFNSYYQTVGRMHPRPERGLLTRPSVAEIQSYRRHVDEHMQQLLDERGDDIKLRELTVLGVNHEQQHQELMLTDVKHVFSCNPLRPVYQQPRARRPTRITALGFQSFAGGLTEIGANRESFCFDNELPRHRVFLEPFALSDRLITNGEYLQFIRDGGYTRADLWLSDGWNLINSADWSRPLYWAEDLQSEFTLSGQRELDLNTPVTHVSYYEADAFARWAGARLLTEAEWEVAAASSSISGNLLDNGELHPVAATATAAAHLTQLFGDVWEWTQSPYAPYPRYSAPAGALGEYNGKFMCSQLVLRGGSCVTARDHIRASYRNFFYPHARWQFTGLRLARDVL